MSVISRRQMLFGGSGVMLTSPVVGSLNALSTGSSLLAASPLESKPQKGCPDLQEYVTSGVPRFIANVRNRSIEFQDFSDLSSKIHLLARNLGTLDTEPLRAALLSAPLPSLLAFDPKKSKSAQKAYSDIAKEAPDLTFEEFASGLTVSPEQLEAGKRQLTQWPIPVYFHVLADSFRHIGTKIKDSGLPSDISMSQDEIVNSPHFVNAVYDPSRAAHLRSTSFCGLSGTQWCTLISTLVAGGVALSLIWAGGETVAAVVAALAEMGITASEEMAAKIIKTISVCSGFIAGICSL